MTLNNYQKQSGELLIPTGRNIVSTLLSVTAKVGELSARVSMALRYGQFMINRNKIMGMSDNREANQKLETEMKICVGDLISRISELCDHFGWELEDICQMNLDKSAQIRENYESARKEKERSK